jgi:hypothetical protein
MRAASARDIGMTSSFTKVDFLLRYIASAHLRRTGISNISTFPTAGFSNYRNNILRPHIHFNGIKGIKRGNEPLEGSSDNSVCSIEKSIHKMYSD